jgi:hypothetical protein
MTKREQQFFYLGLSRSFHSAKQAEKHINSNSILKSETINEIREVCISFYNITMDQFIKDYNYSDARKIFSFLVYNSGLSSMADIAEMVDMSSKTIQRAVYGHKDLLKADAVFKGDFYSIVAILQNREVNFNYE